MSVFQKAWASPAGRALSVAWLKIFAGPDPEIGPRELAILAIGAGVYLATRALWPAGAIGCALIVAGGIQLGVVLWTQAQVAAAKTKKATER